MDDLNEMLEEESPPSAQVVTEIENINELVEQENVVTAQAALAVENPLLLTNSNWINFCELSTRINILNLSGVVDLPIPSTQHVIGETLTNRYDSTRVVTVDADVMIPLITGPASSRINTTSSSGSPLNGFVLKQQKIV